MKGKRILVGAVALLGVVAAGIALYYRPPWRSAPATPPAAAGSEEWTREPNGFLAAHGGKVLVLLMGRDGCPGTAKGTAALDAYAPKKPAEASIVRLDVPLPGEQLKVAADWSHPFPRLVDKDRRLADRLDFFFYPTLYVFDRGGELRFTGGCDGAAVETMVREILAETPGQPKRIYTLPMPAVGQAAPAFSATTLAGQTATLDALRGQRGTLLVFAKTDCPFTVEALPAVKSIAEEYRKDGVAVAIVNNGEDREQLAAVYGKHAPGVAVVWDQAGEVSKAYGVDMTPFYFLLDKDGKIAKRRSFTPAAAAGSLNALLGRGEEATRFKPTEAG